MARFKPPSLFRVTREIERFARWFRATVVFAPLPPSGPSAPGWFIEPGAEPGSVEGQIFDPPLSAGDGPAGGDGAGTITNYVVTIAAVATVHEPTLPIAFAAGGFTPGAPVTASVRALGYGGRAGLLTVQTTTAAEAEPEEPEEPGADYLRDAQTGEAIYDEISGEPLRDKHPVILTGGYGWSYGTAYGVAAEPEEPADRWVLDVGTSGVTFLVYPEASGSWAITLGPLSATFTSYPEFT